MSWVADHVGATIGIAIATVIVLATLSIVAKVALFPLFVAEKAVDVAYGVVDRTFDPDVALAQYEKFRDWFQVYNKSLADAKLFKSQMAEMEKEYPVGLRPRDVRQSITDTRFKMNASITNANRVAGEYNGAASKVNWSIWKGEWLDKALKGESRVDLPEFLAMLTSANLEE